MVVVVSGYHMRRRRCAVAAVGSVMDGAVVVAGEGDKQRSGKRGEGREERRRSRARDRGEERRDGRDLAGRRWLSGAFVCGGAAPTHTHAHAREGKGLEVSVCGRRAEAAATRPTAAAAAAAAAASSQASRTASRQPAVGWRAWARVSGRASG
jgi:hypothetical protein